MALLGTATVNLNATGDTAIPLTSPGGDFIVTGYALSGLTGTVSSVAGNLFVAPLAGGGQLFSVFPWGAASAALNAGHAIGGLNINAQPINLADAYFHISGVNGSPATVNVSIFGEPIG